MEKINLAFGLEGSEYWIEKQQYEILKQKKNPSWTDCLTEEEWLVKLHCLRTLYKNKTIDKEGFKVREEKLILKWWSKFCEQRW